MKTLSFLIKPASSACDLRCSYCFYLDEASHRGKACHPLMKEDVVDAMLQNIFATGDDVILAFQGGEPSLVGLAWYRSFVAKVNKMNTKNVHVSYAFQTNATLIDDDWAAFFHDNHFLVGVSLDGFSRIHNLHRKKGDGSPSFRETMRGIECLKKADAEFNILTVVTNDTVDNLDRIWDFFLEQGFTYQQYIPAIDPMGGDDDTYLSSEAYGKFLISLSERWMEANQQGYPVSIRLFDNFIAMLSGYPVEACDMVGHCSVQYVVEANGDIYPCDFYCTDTFRLGNIMTDSILQMDRKREELSFISGSFPTAKECGTCQLFPLCRGGCKRYRDKEGLFRFCGSYQEFFSRTLPSFQKIAKNYRRENG